MEKVYRHCFCTLTFSHTGIGPRISRQWMHYYGVGLAKFGINRLIKTELATVQIRFFFGGETLFLNSGGVHNIHVDNAIGQLVGVCVWMRACLCPCARSCVGVSMSVCAFVCRRVFVSLFACACARVCVRARVYVCVCVCVSEFTLSISRQYTILLVFV